MTRLHVDLDIPDTLSDELREALQQETREQAVLALFRRGVCSAGVAAGLLGLGYHDFLELLKDRGVDYAPGGPEDSSDDATSMEWLADDGKEGASTA